MKFKVSQNDFFNILKVAKGVIVKHAIQPTLSCFKIDVMDNSIKVTATDLDNQISGTCLAQADGDITFCVDGMKLIEIVSRLTGVIDCEVENGFLFVKNGRTKYKMLIIDASEFAEIAIDFQYQATKLPADFINKLKQVLFCTQTSDTRAIISGVCFDINDCQLSLVATDANRLSIAKMNIENIENNQVVVPQKILNELIKNNYDEIHLAFDNNRVLFICDNLMFTAKVLNGTYPQYQSLMPKSFENIVKVKVADFKEALNKTCVMVDEKTLKVEFKINNNLLKMSAKSCDFGESNDCIDVNSNVAEEKTLKFNNVYVNNCLNVTKEEEITLCFNQELGAVLFKSDFDYLCMPLK